MEIYVINSNIAITVHFFDMEYMYFVLMNQVCLSLMQVTASKKDKPGTEGIEVALNPEELDLDSAAMQAKYDQTMREKQNQLEKEDLSDMVAEHAAKQKVSAPVSVSVSDMQDKHAGEDPVSLCVSCCKASTSSIYDLIT